MRKNFIFAIKCVLVMLPFLWIALYAKNRMMWFTDEEAPYYIWNREFCQNKQEQYYDVVIIGDSVANSAYMPEVLSDSCINLSLGGTTPMENYYTLKEYLENNEAPRSAYISIMDFHFQTSDCYWKRSMYSHRYSAKDSWEMLQKAKEYSEPSIWSDTAYIDWISYELYLPNKYITSISNASFNQRHEENKAAYELNEIHDGRYIARDTGENPITVNFDTFYVAPLFDYYYRKLISLCIENDISVHIIKLPLPDSDTFSEQYVQQVEQYYGAMMKEFPSITFDWWGTYEGYCFADWWHMNNHGALKFSAELKQKYSEDFNNDYSENQLAGIDDYIQNENYLNEIIKWASVCPEYTVIVYDGIGDFPERYENSFKQENIDLIENTFYDQLIGIYVLQDTSERSFFDQFYLGNENLISIYPGDESCYTWNPYNILGVNVLIINNSTRKVVCEKKFQYVKEKESFVLMQ